jgi:hypothetical protein
LDAERSDNFFVSFVVPSAVSKTDRSCIAHATHAPFPTSAQALVGIQPVLFTPPVSLSVLFTCRVCLTQTVSLDLLQTRALPTAAAAAPSPPRRTSSRHPSPARSTVALSVAALLCKWEAPGSKSKAPAPPLHSIAATDAKGVAGNSSVLFSFFSARAEEKEKASAASSDAPPFLSLTENPRVTQVGPSPGARD